METGLTTSFPISPQEYLIIWLYKAEEAFYQYELFMQFLNGYHFSQIILKVLTGNFLPSFDIHFYAQDNASQTGLNLIWLQCFSLAHTPMEAHQSCPATTAGMVFGLMGRKAWCDQDSGRLSTVSQYSHM